jgi:hypothetical protein
MPNNQQQSIFTPLGPQDFEGPFSGFLKPPSERQPPPTPAPMSKAGGIMMAANNFIQGATAGRIRSYEQRENQKLQKLNQLNQYMANVYPTLTPDGQKQAMQIYSRAIGAETLGAMDQGGKGKKGKQGEDQQPGNVHAHFTSILKDIATGMVGGKMPKGAPDVDMHSVIGNLAMIAQDPKNTREGVINSSLSQIDEISKRLPPGATDQDFIGATKTQWSTLTGLDPDRSQREQATRRSAYPAPMTPTEKFENRAYELLEQQGAPQRKPPGPPSGPLEPGTASPAGSARKMFDQQMGVSGATQEKGPPPAAPPMSPYDQAALSYAQKKWFPKPENLKDVRLKLADGSEVPGLEDPQATDPRKRFTDERTGEPIDPSTIKDVNPRATPAESTAKEDRETAYQAYAEKNKLDWKALTATQKEDAWGQWNVKMTDAKQILTDPGTTAFMGQAALTNPQILSAMGGGMGTAAMRRAVINSMAAQAKAAGITPGDLAENWIAVAANKTSLNRLTTQADYTTALSNFLDGQLDRLVSRAKDVGLTDNRYANRSINWFKQNMAGNPKISPYLQIVNAAQTEAAGILGNRAMSSSLPEGARKDMQAFLDGSSTVGQIEGMAKLIKIESAAKLKSLNDQKKAIRDRIINGVAEETDQSDQDPMGILPQQPPSGPVVKK